VRLSDFDAPIVRAVRELTVIVKIPSVARPGREADTRSFMAPFRPFVALEIEKEEFRGIWKAQPCAGRRGTSEG
jgi:hypothetical protein